MTAGAAGRLLAVNVVAAVRPDPATPGTETAIDKRPVAGPVRVGPLGLTGDRQCDTKHHGGPDQAVYAYAREDAAWWEAELGREILAGSFGENLTTEGIDVTGAVIGEQWAIGPVRLQVRSPRTPCRTFQLFWGVRALVRRFTEHGAPGAYLAVLAGGEITAGAPIEVLDRPAHGVTIGEVFRARSGERALVPRLLDAEGLPEKDKAWARRVLATAQR